MHALECTDCQCQTLQYGQSVKYLGMYIDNNMKRNIHIHHIFKKNLPF